MELVDIHSHLLWGLDDGCLDAHETLEAARAMASVGFAELAPSPHAQERYAGGNPALCAARLDEARELVARVGLGLRLHRNAENPLDAGYLGRLARGAAVGLGESQRFALVEFPFADDVGDVESPIREVRSLGVLPIVAHPERCLAFARAGRASQAIHAGAALQLNIGSLIGRHGEMALALSGRFLGEGLYALGGTDLHGPHLAAEWLAQALEALEREAGRAQLERLMGHNPRRALAGEALE